MGIGDWGLKNKNDDIYKKQKAIFNNSGKS